MYNSAVSLWWWLWWQWQPKVIMGFCDSYRCWCGGRSASALVNFYTGITSYVWYYANWCIPYVMGHFNCERRPYSATEVLCLVVFYMDILHAPFPLTFWSCQVQDLFAYIWYIRFGWDLWCPVKHSLHFTGTRWLCLPHFATVIVVLVSWLQVAEAGSQCC